MNIKTSIIAAAATLALAAPVAANAATTKTPKLHSTKPAASIQKKGKVKGATGAPKIAKQAIYPVIYIHVTQTYPVAQGQADQWR